MRIKHGATRHVILTEKYAIKIARLTPVHVLYVSLRFFYRRLRSVVGVQLHKRRSTEHPVLLFLRSIVHHIGLGLRVNRAEAKYWRSTQDPKCVPTLCTLLGGLILIQPRGEVMTESGLWRSSARKHLGDRELSRAEQWCWFKGRPCIVDYAHLGNPRLLFS